MKCVEVETTVEVWVVVRVFWRGISPATAGPARSAERAMLASILSLLIDIGGLRDSDRRRGRV
jgi:hypothetical protein